MASTYTDVGLELIGVGEQANTWGQTTNTNWRLVEELATGVASINLDGLTSYTLTTTPGATSNGRHYVVEFTGFPGATSTVTVSPNTMKKVYVVSNYTDQAVVITQGSGGDIQVPVGASKIIYCDGAGSSARVTDVTANLSVNSLSVSSMYIGPSWSVEEVSGELIFQSTSGGSIKVTASGEIDET